MFWFRRIVRSKWRTLACLVSAIVFSILVTFWSEICLWQAESQFERRNHVVASDWVARSRWFRREIDARTCLLEIRIARRRNHYAEVDAGLLQAVKLGVARTDIQRERWLVLAQTGQFGAMQQHWNELLRDARDDEPEIARAHYSWAMVNHKLEVARRTLELWGKDYPRDPEPLFLSGRFYQSTWQLDGAEDCYRRAFELAPDNDDYRLAFAMLLQTRHKAKDAIPLFQVYLDRHSENLPAVQGLAQCLASVGDTDRGIRLLRDALIKNPRDFTLQKACGELLLSTGDAAAATKLLEKANRTAPENASLANSLARSLKAVGRVDEADRLFVFVADSRPQLDLLVRLETELQSQPDNLELRMKIGSITARYLSRPDAIRWYENLLRLAPGFLPAHKELTDLYRETGDEALAEHHARFVQQVKTSTTSN